jgi:hypothetical protein
MRQPANRQMHSCCNEEISSLMRKWLVLTVAVAAVLAPAAASAQAVPEQGKSGGAAKEFKYKFYLGPSYTSLNQVNQSRYGLVGANVEISRDFGRRFALVADGATFTHSVASGNPGNPSVDMVLFGPELHGELYENWSLFVRAWLGGAHTGGESQTPNISFAGGFGLGAEHVLHGGHWAVRASGDDIGSAFSLRNNTPQLGNSAHTRFNARAGIGIVYRF